MQPYDDILRNAIESAPWEVRSVNGAHHDRVDWCIDTERFPLPITRVLSESDNDEGKRSNHTRDDRKGSWGGFELPGGSRTSGGFEFLEPREPESAGERALASLALISQEGVSSAAPKPQVGDTEAAPSAFSLTKGLSALAALRSLSRTKATEQEDDPQSAEISLASETVDDTASQTTADKADPPKEKSGLDALIDLLDKTSEERAEIDATLEDVGLHPDDRNTPVGTITTINHFLMAMGDKVVNDKPPIEERRLSLVGVEDRFAARLLRSCLLASALEKRPMNGLSEVASYKDLEECENVVYLSPALCPGDGWSPYSGSNDTQETEAMASASLDALTEAYLPGNPLATPGARAENAFVLIDFVGALWLKDPLPSAITHALKVARCVVVLAEPSRMEVWEKLLDLLPAAFAPAEETGDSLRTMNLFSLDSQTMQNPVTRRRFLHTWWRWFGTGARWGYHDLALSLDRTLSILGFNMHSRRHDLGLLSILAAQIRDGGTIASADDVAEAFSDRTRDRSIVSALISTIMETLPTGAAKTYNDRVLVDLEHFDTVLTQKAGTGASLLSSRALPLSSSLQMLFRIEESQIEVRFSSLFACLAAQWLLEDASKSLVHIADELKHLHANVPRGGWGRIVLQTVLLAEQRDRSFASRVILDRLYEHISDRQTRKMLVEISLGVRIDAPDAMPLIWKNHFFTGTVATAQATVLREARESGWLREDNLLVMEHFATDLYRRAKHGENLGVAPAEMIESCHWLDVLLRATRCTSSKDLLNQIGCDIHSSSDEVRTRALGRYDCLTWAILFGAMLPCPSYPSDIEHSETFQEIARIAASELATEGPAYAECANFAWIYATRYPLLTDDEWELIRTAAVRIIEDAAKNCGTDASLQRFNAYSVLAAYLLWKDPSPRDEHPGIEPVELSQKALMQLGNDLIIANSDGWLTRATNCVFALAGLGLITTSQASAIILQLEGASEMPVLAKRMFLLLDPNPDPTSTPTERTLDQLLRIARQTSSPNPSNARSPEQIKLDWRECVNTLLKEFL